MDEALASFDIESYESVLNDPEAGSARGFEWIAYTGIISGLIAPFTLVNSPEFSELVNSSEFKALFGNMSMAALMVGFAVVLALVTPIMSVIGLAINAGIQNVLAGFFGGNGYYGRTVYALAAYLAPMTILIALLGIIPLLGQSDGSAWLIQHCFERTCAAGCTFNFHRAGARGYVYSRPHFLCVNMLGPLCYDPGRIRLKNNVIL